MMVKPRPFRTHSIPQKLFTQADINIAISTERERILAEFYHEMKDRDPKQGTKFFLFEIEKIVFDR